MAKATTSIVISFRKKKIDKIPAVADPANEDDFMAEVCFHPSGRSLHCQVENHVRTKKIYFF
jgi:hypothetical protein